eukprot:SAG31_NODE_1386_length_8574_cov_2.055037_13_plen_89_part_00
MSAHKRPHLQVQPAVPVPIANEHALDVAVRADQSSSSSDSDHDSETSSDDIEVKDASSTRPAESGAATIREQDRSSEDSSDLSDSCDA